MVVGDKELSEKGRCYAAAPNNLCIIGINLFVIELTSPAFIYNKGEEARIVNQIVLFHFSI